MSNTKEINIKPSFEEWKATTGIQLAPDSAYSLYSLYDAVTIKKELKLSQENGEWIRYGQIAVIDIFYDAPNGKLYKLREKRNTLKPDWDHREALKLLLAGDTSGVIPSRDRITPTSISERLKLDGESIEDATVRALHEEVLDDTKEEIIEELGHDPFTDLDDILKSALIFGTSTTETKEANSDYNSYKGVAAIYDTFPSRIVFTNDINVPIRLINNIPQTMHAFEEGKYLNLYVWDEIDRNQVTGAEVTRR